MARCVPANRSNFWAYHVGNGNQNSLPPKKLKMCFILQPQRVSGKCKNMGLHFDAFWTHLHSATYTNRAPLLEEEPMKPCRFPPHGGMMEEIYWKDPRPGGDFAVSHDCVTGWLGDWVNSKPVNENHFAWADSSGTNKSTNQKKSFPGSYSTPPHSQTERREWLGQKHDGGIGHVRQVRWFQYRVPQVIQWFRTDFVVYSHAVFWVQKSQFET